MKEKRIIYLGVAVVIIIIVICFLITIISKKDNDSKEVLHNRAVTVYDSDISLLNWKQYLDVDGDIKQENGKIIYKFIVSSKNQGVVIDDFHAKAKFIFSNAYIKGNNSSRKLVKLILDDVKKEGDHFVFEGTYSEEGIQFQDVSLKENYISNFFKFTEISGYINLE